MMFRLFVAVKLYRLPKGGKTWSPPLEKVPLQKGGNNTAFQFGVNVFTQRHLLRGKGSCESTTIGREGKGGIGLVLLRVVLTKIKMLQEIGYTRNIWVLC